MEPILVNTAEAAKMLGMSRQQFYVFAREKGIPYRNMGMAARSQHAKRLYRPEDITRAAADIPVITPVSPADFAKTLAESV